ncbi:hypothetical protein PT974_03174 [Cladobotryum mycophilum]|uniref:2EXR domain-containing protein n=1 Tax=Cladobotryum mycophilum TaxID=491253 RepID=A0ABR0SSS5_9HYPO
MSRGPFENESVSESDESNESEGSELDSESEAGGGLLDIEAEDESEDGSEDSYDEAAENEFWNGEESDDETADSRTFENFGNLPPELRQYIWKLAGLSLEHPRVLQFRIYPTFRIDIHAGEGLLAQTRTARRLLAVNREAREVTLKTLPDTLKIQQAGGRHGVIQFNKERDVVMIDGYEEVDFDNDFVFDDFAESVKQLAVNSWDFSSDFGIGKRFMPFLRQFPNMKRLFMAGMDEEFGTKERHRLWCGSDFVYTFDFTFVETLLGLGQRRVTKMCWPNLDEYDDYAKNEVPKHHYSSLPAGALDKLTDRGVETWPMLIFEDDIGLARFGFLEQKWEQSLGDVFLQHDENDDDDDDDESGSSHSDDSGPSDGFLDEYEDDFIDDTGFVEEVTEHSGVLHAEEVEDVSGDEIFDDEEEASDNERDTQAEAHFSSPEPEPNDDQPDEDDDAKPTTRSRKRQIVTDSDDESATENTRGKRARTSRTVLSDSEDEDEEGGVVHSADANGAPSSPEPKPKNTVTGAKQAVVVDDDSESESEDSSGDEEDEEEEEEQPKRMSLAERLQIARAAHPVSSEDENESGDEDNDELDEDEEEDDEDEDSDGGLIDGMAEESDDGDEDDY